MKVKELIKLLENDGWYIDQMRGSHRQYVHPAKKGTLTIPGYLSDTIHPKIAKESLKVAGLLPTGEEE